MHEESIGALDPMRFDGLLGQARSRELAATLAASQLRLGGRTFWHLNSTSQGGGVAEILQSVLGYLVGGGIRTRWLVVDGTGEFFEVTKRIHKLLHGQPDGDGDGGFLRDADRAIYESTLATNIDPILRLVRPGDAVVLHDPQTLGLAPSLRHAGVEVIWTCHVGSDQPNEYTEAVWEFLRPYLRATAAQVFSRPQYVWDGLDDARTAVIPPCLDAFSPKNQFLDADTVDAILAAGRSPAGSGSEPELVRAARRQPCHRGDRRRSSGNCAGPARGATGLANLTLGSAEGPRRGHAGLRQPGARRAGCPSLAGGPQPRGRRRRPGGVLIIRAVARRVAATAGGLP
jgi:trehalose synthase